MAEDTMEEAPPIESEDTFAEKWAAAINSYNEETKVSEGIEGGMWECSGCGFVYDTSALRKHAVTKQEFDDDGWGASPEHYADIKKMVDVYVSKCNRPEDLNGKAFLELEDKICERIVTEHEKWCENAVPNNPLDPESPNKVYVYGKPDGRLLHSERNKLDSVSVRIWLKCEDRNDEMRNRIRRPNTHITVEKTDSTGVKLYRKAHVVNRARPPQEDTHYLVIFEDNSEENVSMDDIWTLERVEYGPLVTYLPYLKGETAPRPELHAGLYAIYLFAKEYPWVISTIGNLTGYIHNIPEKRTELFASMAVDKHTIDNDIGRMIMENVTRLLAYKAEQALRDDINLKLAGDGHYMATDEAPKKKQKKQKASGYINTSKRRSKKRRSKKRRLKRRTNKRRSKRRTKRR